MTHFEFGQHIAIARKLKGLPAARHLAAEINCTASRMESAEAGHRPLPVTIIQELVAFFDDPQFDLAAARYITLGRVGMVAGALCGVRTAAAMAITVELNEVREDLARATLDLLRGPALAERGTVESVFSNLLDMDMTSNQLKIELGRDYGLSMRSMHERHLREVQSKGYIAAKANGRPLARTA